MKAVVPSYYRAVISEISSSSKGMAHYNTIMYLFPARNPNHGLRLVVRDVLGWFVDEK